MAAARTITAAFVEAPFKITFRRVELRSPQRGEALVDVLACGICGHDMEICSELATTPRAFGHEIAAVVREVGDGVAHIKPGDLVALESASFCGECNLCRNGRVDLCNKAPGFWGGPSMGFSDAMLIPAHCAVPAPDMQPLEAVLAEPCGVAVDMIKVAEIALSDRVLVVGAGAIGLMALAIARRLTSGVVVATARSDAKLEWARKLGADAVVNTSKAALAECGKPYGGFDRILVTAPPQTLPACLAAGAYGAYVVYVGFDWGPGGVIQLDTTAMHVGKKQLRASFASPAVYFPEALQLLRSGAVPARQLVSHRFPLSRLDEALATVREERGTVRKAVVIPDAQFDKVPAL
ncbi:MAG: putative zinc-type alcohol dehydrogenase-like protein YjmD [Lentisphaerae bacterium ADurb.BinA184]|nr:MAG: putative zinc-type alcohol dehydrogenase-like protein YjmD [Lentisphaerae bacterium ADurb.BinA184]